MEEKLYHAIEHIKSAILQAQYVASKGANQVQLSLYYGIGKYVSENTRNGFWGTGAIRTISETLKKEMPGLRGFSEANIKKMRIFYEEWSEQLNLPDKSDKLPNRSTVANEINITDLMILNRSTLSNDMADFLSIGFSQHIEILFKVKEIKERQFYIRQTSANHWGG